LPTKRAPDAGDSAAFPSLFLRLILFPIGRRSAARPSAGNANRWQELAVNLSFVFQNFLVGKIGVLSLANQGFGFSKFSGSIKFGIFSGGSFQNFIRFKIGSWFWFKKFRVKSAQVAKIGFKVFSQSLGKQVVSFCKVRFCGLRFFWQSQVSKIGYIFSAKVLAGLIQAFLPGLFFLA